MDTQQNEERQQNQADFNDNDWCWGREEIGKALGGRTPSQVSYLMATGVLDGAVKRIGHRTYIGSKKKLRELAAKLIDQSS